MLCLSRLLAPVQSGHLGCLKFSLSPFLEAVCAFGKMCPYLLPWINLSMKIDDNRSWGGIWSLSRTWWEFEQSIFENPCLPSNNYNPFLNFTMNSSKRSRPINRLWKTSQLFTYPICTAGPSIWINFSVLLRTLEVLLSSKVFKLHT